MLYEYLRKKFPPWLANTLIVTAYSLLILVIYVLLDCPNIPFRYQK